MFTRALASSAISRAVFLFGTVFFMLYKVFLTFLSVNETLVCDQSNESYWAVLLSGTAYYAEQGVSNFPVCIWKPSVWPIKWKLSSSTFMW